MELYHTRSSCVNLDPPLCDRSNHVSFHAIPNPHKLICRGVRPLLVGLFLLIQISLESAPDFPNRIQLRTHNLNFTLDKTGWAEKNGTYAIAHYLQGAMNAQERVILFQIFTDGEAKEFLIEWKKDLSAKEVQEELKSSFTQALKKSEFEENSAYIDTFLSLFDQDIKEGVQTKILWMANGKLQVFIDSVKRGEINSIPFAKAVWKIWLGQNSVVQKKLLVDEYINTESLD